VQRSDWAGADQMGPLAPSRYEDTWKTLQGVSRMRLQGRAQSKLSGRPLVLETVDGCCRDRRTGGAEVGLGWGVTDGAPESATQGARDTKPVWQDAAAGDGAAMLSWL